MKKTIIWFLLITLLLQISGCYTFNEIGRHNDYTDKVIEENDIIIKLKTGEEIFSKAYFHTTTIDSVDYIVGKGTIYSPDKKVSEPFGGRISKAEIDSMKFDNNFLYIWLNNKQRITLEQSNYLEVQSDSVKGLLLTDNGVLNKIPFDNIHSIEVNEYNSTLTLITIIGTAVLIIGIVVAASLPIFDGPIFENGSF